MQFIRKKMNSTNFIELKWAAPLQEKSYSFGISSDRVRSVNHEVFFTAEVDAGSIESLIREFDTVISRMSQNGSSVLTKDSDKKRIILHIDSPGGTLKDCFKFIDFVQIMKRTHNVHLVTVGTGLVASAATLMGLVGDERYVTENVTCMIHELFGGTIGTYTHLSSGMKRLSMYHDKLIRIYLENNRKMTYDRIVQLLKDETWFDAHEYIEAGFADGVYLAERKRKRDETHYDNVKKARHTHFDNQ